MLKQFYYKYVKLCSFFNTVGICPAAGKGLKTSKCPEVRKFSRISGKSLSLDHYFEFIPSSIVSY